MLIAIDYDDTFTRDPVLWGMFADLVHGRGHHLVCVTARDVPPIEGREPPLPDGVRCVCTNGAPKREFARKMNVHPHVWIDDTPESIGVAMVLDFDRDD